MAEGAIDQGVTFGSWTTEQSMIKQFVDLIDLKDASVFCCDKLAIENFGGQGQSMGVYIKMTDVIHNERPVYARRDNSEYLWNNGYLDGWVVGQDYTGQDSTGISIKNEVRLQTVKIYVNYC